MSSFSILKLGATCQAIQSFMPRLLNVTCRKTTDTIARNVHHMCERRVNLIPHTMTQNNNTLLAQPISPVIIPVCGMKVRGNLHLRCKDCYFVTRRERLYVMCKTHPRHKQTQMKKRDYKTWILTHATQSPVRPWW